MSREKILVVDDEDHIVELISYNLINSDYEVLSANDGVSAIEIAKREQPKLVLLDLMIPGADGYDVCKALRQDENTKSISIIMLTAKGEELDKILGLELGADDYITKPFSIRELLARIKAVLRRSSNSSTNEEFFKGSGININFSRREVLVSEEKIDLTLKEFELLEILVKNKGKILTRETLLDKIWGYEFVGETRTVDVHIRYLRKKIEEDDKNPKFIETIRGVGYRFNPNN
jgi:two-component system, OmpR family, alkaline phosphatase synthesis response regulator PhoP